MNLIWWDARLAPALSMNRKLDLGNSEARPHPVPLPGGEGETLPASWRYVGAGLASVLGFNARMGRGNPSPAFLRPREFILRPREREKVAGGRMRVTTEEQTPVEKVPAGRMRVVGMARASKAPEGR